MQLNWLPVTFGLKQCVNVSTFKYFNEQCLNHLSEVYNVAAESNFKLNGSFQKLKCRFHRINSFLEQNLGHTQAYKQS